MTARAADLVRIRDVATLDCGRGVLVGNGGAARVSPMHELLLVVLNDHPPTEFVPTQVLAEAMSAGTRRVSRGGVSSTISMLRDVLTRAAPGLEIGARWGRGYRLAVRPR